MNFTFHQLTVFVEIVEKKSITKAASSLNLTQPAVSIQLKNFQDQFDLPLTEVVARKLYITDFGTEVYAIARSILQEASSIEHKLAERRGVLSGTLSISSVSTGKYVLPYFLREFLQQHPAVDLSLDVTNRDRVIQNLKNNEVDFSFVSILPTGIPLHEETLIANKLHLIGSQDAKYPSTHLQKKNFFKNLPLIFREEGSGTRITMQRYFTRERIEPRVRLQLTSNEAVKQAVIAGLGFSVISVLSLKNELQNNDVRIIPVKGFPIVSAWRLIWLRNKKLSGVASAYLEFIRAHKKTISRDYFSWAEKY